MTTALIADDEPNLAQHLAERLRVFWPEISIAAIASNGMQAISEITRHRPDVAFLDIRMPGLDGLQVAQAVRDTRVVFVTAHEEYAVSAFELAAIDYLLKPVSDARLAQCVTRLQQSAKPDVDWHALSAVLARPTQSGLHWLTVGLAGTTRLVSVNEVLYFQSTDKYTEAVTARERHLIRTPLKELLAQLNPQQFAQIHRSTIVNLNAVACIETDLLGRRHVHLKDSADALSLSRGFADRFKQM